jgi:diaminopimelate epimerase
MLIRFDKVHGSGNDFALVDARALKLGENEWATLARALADRAGPVGSDGLLALVPGREGAAFGMRMWNSDGSEAETCLNGLRCVARAGFEALGLDEATVSLATSQAAVARDAELAAQVYTVRETAGPASTDSGDWLRLGAARTIDTPVAPLGDVAITAIEIGNPHLIAFVAAIDEAELVRLGRLCEAAPDWLPGRANLSFVERRGADLFVRTFERGVGLTDSCGSAMAASAHAAALTGRIAWDRPLTVFNAGGRVRALPHADGRVTLSGNATIEWRGEIEVDLASGACGTVRIAADRPDERAAWAAVVE